MRTNPAMRLILSILCILISAEGFAAPREKTKTIRYDFKGPAYALQHYYHLPFTLTPRLFDESGQTIKPETVEALERPPMKTASLQRHSRKNRKHRRKILGKLYLRQSDIKKFRNPAERAKLRKEYWAFIAQEREISYKLRQQRQEEHLTEELRALGKSSMDHASQNSQNASAKLQTANNVKHPFLDKHPFLNALVEHLKNPSWLDFVTAFAVLILIVVVVRFILANREPQTLIGGS